MILSFSGGLLQLLLAEFACLFSVMLCVRGEQLPTSTESPTNGITASGNYWPERLGGAYVQVFIHFSPPNTNVTFGAFGVIVKQTNGTEVAQEPIQVARYFLATNSFCGFIELRDEKGKKVPLLKPGVNSQDSYPPSYSLTTAQRLLARNVGLGASLPAALSGNDAEFGFPLTKYFRLDEPGKYQLTIWPKIYKRSDADRDLVKRIDLSPVTIPIKWGEVSPH